MFGDTFDGYDTSQRLTKWTNEIFATGGAVITPSAARNGPNGMRVTVGANPSAQCFIRKTLTPVDPTTVVFGTAFRYNVTPSAEPITFMGFLDVADVQFGLAILPNGKISPFRGGFSNVTPRSQIFDPTSLALLQGNFYHLKVIATINAVTGTIGVWLNRVLVLNLTGINTSQSGAANWDGVFLGTCGNTGTTDNGGIFDFDDFYVRNNDTPSKFDLTGLALFAQDGNGDLAQYTTSAGGDHGALVKDPVPDDDATYNETDTVGNIDTYEMDDMPANATVAFTQSVDVCRKVDEGDCLAADVLRIGSVNYVGPDYAPNTTYAQMLTPYDVSPATGVAFTSTEINALQAGQKKTA